MELTIKLLTGRNAGQEIKVPVNKFLIGRASDCHLRPHSDLVSRHHCVLLVEEGFCAVRDFGSRNGTLLNDEPVVGQRELRNGDRLKIGNLEFEVELTSSVGGKKRPKVKDVKDAAQRTAAAGATSGNHDENISDWLTIDESAGESKRRDQVEKQRPPHETPAVSMAHRETTFLKTPTDETTTVQPVDAKDTKANQMPAAGGGDAAKRMLGGKIVVPPKVPPKNSHEAATQALKKLFNSRKP
jgi:pSer/pThr/pTyr-binding forkhead associated (FHA) protein